MWNLWGNDFLISYVVCIGFSRFCLNCMGVNVKGLLHGHCTILIKKLKLAEISFINRNCFIDNNADINIEQYLQPIITQYFTDNKSEIWSLSLIAHSKR